VILVESVLIRVRKRRPVSIFLSSITLFHLAYCLNSSWCTSCMLLCVSCILDNHTPISTTWLSLVISSWKDIPPLSQNIAARRRIQWVISGWKSRLERSKKEKTSDMVGCYTDATNPRVRGGFIA
jgi:hypothetical protein